ncbi:hypothetical protein BSKO_07324 [Bryopsis sp. KO-2023]|nr:hypothetical protein BSKO_07324 [Bryopsis sp. KO-2023]
MSDSVEERKSLKGICNTLSQFDDFGFLIPADPLYQLPAWKGSVWMGSGSRLRDPTSSEVYTIMEPEDQLLDLSKSATARMPASLKVEAYKDFDDIFFSTLV